MEKILKNVIVIEGIDGCGKSSQVNLLVNAIRNYDKNMRLKVDAEPTGGPIGKLIRKHLSGEYTCSPESMIHMFAADRSLHLDDIRNFLDNPENSMVICDRYMYSSMVYQSLQMGSMDYVAKMNSEFPRPELLIYMHMDSDRALARVHGRDTTKDLFEHQDFLSMCEKAYNKLINDEIKRDVCNILTVNADAPMHDVHAQIWNSVEKMIIRIHERSTNPTMSIY
jgi:dTMP kinase